MKGLPVGFGTAARSEGSQDQDSTAENATADSSGDELDWGWGAVVNLHKKPAKKTGEPATYEVEVLVMCKAEGGEQEAAQSKRPTPTANGVQVGLLDCGIVELSEARWGLAAVMTALANALVIFARILRGSVLRM